MTFVVVNAVRSSLAARLDMVVPSLKVDTPTIRREPVLRYCNTGYQIDARRAWRSQKSEPGRPGPRYGILLGTRSGRVTSGRRDQDGVDHMDHAVRLIDVRDRDGRRTALGVDDHHLAARGGHG